MSKVYVLGGLLLIVLFLFVGILVRFTDFQSGLADTCVDSRTGANMSWEMARSIALASECAEGNLTDFRMCNAYTGTWWIELDLDRPGCSPACVVDVNTGEAKINWRCTGLR